MKSFIKRLGKELMDDGVTDVGAMMAYYAVLAIVPMMVFVLSIAMLVLDDSTVRDGANMALSAVPGSTRALIMERVDALIKASGAGFAIIAKSWRRGQRRKRRARAARRWWPENR